MTTLPPSCAIMKSGNLNFLEPSGPLQACNGTALPNNKVYCTLHCTFAVYFLSLICMKLRDSDVLAKSSRDDRAMKKYSTCTVQYHVHFKWMTEQ